MRIVIRGIKDLQAMMGKASASIQTDLRQLAGVAVRDIQEQAQNSHAFRTRTGAVERSIETSVEGAGTDFRGEVFTLYPVAIYQHEGAKAHTIVPRKKMALRWVGGGGFVFAKRVRHPGIKGDPFIYNAATAMEPSIVSRFNAYIGSITAGGTK